MSFNFNKWNTALGWLTFFIALIVYSLTVEPTMSFWDCGEYIATAAKLEVGHPPGAPLFQMIGAFFAMFATDNQHIALMVNMVVESANQVFITTHSPYILSYLNNLLFAWKVGQIQPEAENKIAIEFRLNPADFGAYVLRDGHSHSIFDTQTGLIDRNYLDEIFEEIGFEYDALYDVYADFITSNTDH